MAVPPVPTTPASTNRAGAVCLPSFVFICTANRCRSPLAAAIARQQLARRGRTARVESFGLMASGKPTPDTGIGVAAERGLSLAGHRSVRLRGSRIQPNDLLLTMTRAQAREVVAAKPDLWPRVFTLMSFAELATDQPAYRRSCFLDWVEFLGSERPRTALLGDGRADEVPDPMGQPAEMWREVAASLDRTIDRVLTASDAVLTLPAQQAHS